jgi:hypothetical protein
MQCCGTPLIIMNITLKKHNFKELIPVEVRSKAWICTRAIAGIAVSSLADSTGFHLLYLL